MKARRFAPLRGDNERPLCAGTKRFRPTVVGRPRPVMFLPVVGNRIADAGQFPWRSRSVAIATTVQVASNAHSALGPLINGPSRRSRLSRIPWKAHCRSRSSRQVVAPSKFLSIQRRWLIADLVSLEIAIELAASLVGGIPHPTDAHMHRKCRSPQRRFGAGKRGLASVAPARRQMPQADAVALDGMASADLLGQRLQRSRGKRQSVARWQRALATRAGHGLLALRDSTQAMPALPKPRGDSWNSARKRPASYALPSA